MKLNRVGYAVLGIFLVVGIVFLFIDGLFRIVGIAFLASVVYQVVYLLRQRRQAGREDALVQNAVRGRGTIVEANRTGGDGHQATVRLVLDIAVPDRQPWRAETTATMAEYAAGMMRPGLVLPVHVDARDPSKFLVQW